MTPPAATFALSDLARAFGIAPRTIRLREDRGRLAPERDGRRRVMVTAKNPESAQ